MKYRKQNKKGGKSKQSSDKRGEYKREREKETKLDQHEK